MEKDSYVTKMIAGNAPLFKGKMSIIINLDIELTERCNNNCIHCYINLPVDDRVAREKELSTEEIKNIIKEAASLGCLSVRFTGGEPLLREDFEELYVFTRKLGIKVLLFTNATLITSHLAELFVRIPPLRNIEITVYGMKENSYEAVTRTPGSFAAAWQGINLLLDRNIPFVVKGALLPPNKEEMDEFKAWALSFPQMYKLPTYSMFFDLRGRRDSEQKNRLIKGLRVSPEERLSILDSMPDKYMKKSVSFAPNSYAPRAINFSPAGQG